MTINEAGVVRVEIDGQWFRAPPGFPDVLGSVRFRMGGRIYLLESISGSPGYFNRSLARVTLHSFY
jgi:hypothetical protein